MKPIIRTLNLVFIFVTIFATLITVKAHSKNRCEGLFAKPSVYGTSLNHLKLLDYNTLDLLEALKNNPREIDRVMLDAKIAQITILAEKYFESNALFFEKKDTTISVKNLKDTEQYTLQYPVYSIYGSKEGDGISRLMYGAQSKLKTKNYSLNIVFDLLYKIKYPDFSGHFIAEGGTIFIGSHVISEDIAGLGATLRHEIQHYFEQTKMLNGNMTLSRISFTESKVSAQENGPYSNFLRMDEIETHLRDLRTSLNVNLMNAKDKKLFDVIAATENITAIKQIRPRIAKEIYKRIWILIDRSKVTLKNIKNVREFPSTVINTDTGAVTVEFVGLPPPYSTVKIELSGRLNHKEDIINRQKIFNSIKEVIQWNEKRVQKIEAELLFLATKLPID